MENFIKIELNYKIIFCRKTFLFGVLSNLHKFAGLNHFLIETKKFIFYDLRNSETFDAEFMFELFKTKLKYIIIKEKAIAMQRGKFDSFCEKWFNFAPIYNFYGPDPE